MGLRTPDWPTETLWAPRRQKSLEYTPINGEDLAADLPNVLIRQLRLDALIKWHGVGSKVGLLH